MVSDNSKNLSAWSRVEPWFRERLAGEEGEPRATTSKGLLTWNRIDIGIKLAYLRYRQTCPDLAERLYAAHIRAFTLGRYVEPGNPLKNGIDKYVKEFDNIERSIRYQGFRSDVSLIPVASDGSILNGAHRVAACVMHGREVSVVQIDHAPSMYDWKFFRDRGMELDLLELAVLEYPRYRDDIYVAVIWPSAQDLIGESCFENVLYHKDFDVSYVGLRQAVTEVYWREQWLGSAAEKFSGAHAKAKMCFHPGKRLRVVVFQEGSLARVQAIKEDIRRQVGLGKHSLHITDTHHESIRLLNLFLTEASRHFLLMGNPFHFPDTFLKLGSLEEALNEAGADASSVVDSGLVLEVYGVRKARDWDVIGMVPLEEGVDDHEGDLIWHKLSKSEILCNPLITFQRFGLRFVSLKQVLEMKRNRGEPKDLEDLMLIAKLGLDKDMLRTRRRSDWLLLFGYRVRSGIIALLRAAGIYRLVRGVYRVALGRSID